MRFLSYASLTALVSTIKNRFAPITHTHTASDLTGVLPIAKGGTGAGIRSDSFKNLSFESYTCTKLSEDNSYYTDLDDFKSAGNYYVKSNDNAYSIISNATIVNGWLVVIPSTGTAIKQIFYRYGSATSNNDHQTYVRTYFSSGWTEWTRFYNSKDVIPIVNGGTGATTASAAFKNLTYKYYTLSSLSELDDMMSPCMGFVECTGSSPLIPNTSISYGWLTILPSPNNSCKQILYVYHTDITTSNETYIRTYLEGTGWNNWSRLYTSGDTIPMENGGTGAITAQAALANLGVATANSGESGSVKIGDILIQWGRVRITNTDTETIVSQTATFESDLQYSSIPRVFVTPLTGAAGKVQATAVPTTSGITVYLLRSNNTATTSIDWVTVGVSA